MVNRRELLNGFQFDQHLVGDHEIGSQRPNHLPAVPHVESLLRFVAYAARFQLISCLSCFRAFRGERVAGR